MFVLMPNGWTDKGVSCVAATNPPFRTPFRESLAPTGGCFFDRDMRSPQIWKRCTVSFSTPSMIGRPKSERIEDGLKRINPACSAMAMHTQNLQADPHASLFVTEPDASGHPLG